MKITKPCAECPYKLGLIKALVNPCPQCKANGYKTFEMFKRKFPTAAYPSDDNNTKWRRNDYGT